MFMNWSDARDRFLVSDAAENVFFRASPIVRRGCVVLHLLLALMAALQIVDPGALARVQLQPSGQVLLIAVAALSALAAIFSAGRLFTRRTAPGLESGATDALLHATIALVGFDYVFGDRLLEPAQTALLTAVLGAMLSMAAVALVWGALRRRTDRAEHDQHRRGRRDLAVRGALLTVLGLALLLASGLTPFAMDDTMASALWGSVALALGSYALHTIWLLGDQARGWSHGN